jgi:acylphosphatase
MESIRQRVNISGQVQGVFFRESARQRARELRLNGWVRNRQDGRVEAVFEGKPEAVEEIIRWCQEGPSGAQVSGVEVVEEETDEPLPGFSIRRTE